MDKIGKEFLKSEEGRKWFIEKTLKAVPKDKNWQQFHTPYDEICEKMISKATKPLEDKNILVLFNVEFLEVLIHKFDIPSKNITFLTDCKLEYEIATKIYRVDANVIENNDINSIQKELKKLKIFDLCFTNPPYLGATHTKIISEVLTICNEIVVVHPAIWLLDNKHIVSSYFTKYREIIKKYSEEAYIFDGNSVFNIVGPCSPFTIFKINKKYNGKIKVNYFDEQHYEVDSIYDITVFGQDWFHIVKPLVEKMKKYDNIWEWNQRGKKINKIPKNKFYFQCRALVPGTAGNDVHNCLIQLNSSHERYIKTYDTLGGRVIIFYFETENEVHNFIEYLKTDFVRFCISIYKIRQDFDNGELKLVPIMDFTKKWTDKDLYKYFSIPQETVDYITNIFPEDLYELRK